MNSFEIKDIDSLFSRELEKDRKIIKTNISTLLAPGENFGSLILQVDLIIEDVNSKQTKVIHSVLKTIPPSEKMQEVFNIQVTVKNEIEFYRTILPALEEFQKEYRIEPHIFAAKLYGARINLNGSDVVDQDAALVFENLSYEGFKCLDRFIGFDYDATLFLLKELALLHATTIALKLKQPEVFREKIKKCLIPPMDLKIYTEENPMIETLKKYLPAALEQDEECKQYVDRVLKAVGFKKPGPPREPFATISHSDFWMNNTMVKIVDGKVVENRMVDFQLFEYTSAANDVLFFLFTSVQDKVLVPNVEQFLDYYHKEFINRLEQFKCDISEFNYDAFLKECELSSKESQFNHCLYVFLPIFTEKGTMDDISKLTPEQFRETPLNQKQTEKVHIIVKEFIKRNWI